ncbi:MAG: GTP 3',8-cyclase MoaA [Bacillota bacterium]|nr:GTP 3',8-cyclase MoaA [Bacillota bacterium]
MEKVGTTGDCRALTDSRNRVIEYLRLSVTDRCNLHCAYCMPGKCDYERQNELLSWGEMEYICRMLSEEGLKKIKITGGEPLLREGVSEFIGVLKKIPRISSVTLTTNGQLLSDYLPKLKEAGVDGVNVSVDSLKPEVYKTITGSEGLNRVLEAVYACSDAGIRTKINCVTMEGVNRSEAADFALIAKDRSIDVRFIEMMPMGAGCLFKPVTGGQILEDLRKRFDLRPTGETRGNGPAVYYSAEGFQGRIGFINAVSCGFCESCNRMRITAGGKLQLCLAHSCGIDIKELLRSGLSREEIVLKIREAVFKKPAGHDFSAAKHESSDSMMWRIGG